MLPAFSQNVFYTFLSYFLEKWTNRSRNFIFNFFFSLAFFFLGFRLYFSNMLIVAYFIRYYIVHNCHTFSICNVSHNKVKYNSKIISCIKIDRTV